MDEINEVMIKEAITPISLRKTRKILEQMEIVFVKCMLKEEKEQDFL